MANRKCRNCGLVSMGSADSCKRCGTSFDGLNTPAFRPPVIERNQKPTSPKGTPWIIGTLLGLFGIPLSLLGVFFISRGGGVEVLAMGAAMTIGGGLVAAGKKLGMYVYAVPILGILIMVILRDGVSQPLIGGMVIHGLLLTGLLIESARGRLA